VAARLAPPAAARVEPVIAERVPAAGAVLFVGERRVERDGVTAERSLSKSFNNARLVFWASRRSAFIVLVRSL
jgi:hypothetical protein